MPMRTTKTSTQSNLIELVGPELFSILLRYNWVQLVILFYFRFSVMLFDFTGISIFVGQHVAPVESSSLILHVTLWDVLLYSDD